MSEIKDITEQIKKFRDARDWQQFHTHKDMAISIAVEAAEILEHFQFKTPEQIEDRIRTHRQDISDEIADVAIYLFELADNLQINLRQAIEHKLEKSALKYPIDKAKGSNKKYTEL
jgi:NTP pyrophosphatase (non-canonical NTP hydrolase)